VEAVIAGRAISSTNHDKLTISTSYDALWRTAIVYDSRNNPKTTSYVPGTTEIFTVTDATGAVIQTNTYDTTGRKLTSEDAGGHYTRYAYNARDQVVNQWGDAVSPTSYSYDPIFAEELAISTYRGGSGWSGTTWPTGAGTADTTTWTYDAPSGLQTSKPKGSTQ
jgi:YD repeat-containing protein